jgi:hypothetical protein
VFAALFAGRSLRRGASGAAEQAQANANIRLTNITMVHNLVFCIFSSFGDDPEFEEKIRFRQR